MARFLIFLCIVLSSRGFAVQKSVAAGPATEAAQRLQLEAAAEREVAARCVAGGKTDPKDLGKWLSEKITSDVVLRKKVVQHLRNRASGSPCLEFLKERLAAAQKSLQDKSFDLSKQSYRPFVLLAVAAGLPEGKTVLADLSTHDESGDWLMALSSFAPEAYSAALEASVDRIANQVRSELGLSLVPSNMYGKVKENVFTEKSVRFQNPLLVHSYLSDLIDDKKKPGPEVWARLNLLYATMGRIDKTTSTQLFKDMIRKHDSDWIMSFRKEPVWVQFRLLPLAAGAGGPEIVRELLWLSENALDEQVRLLASSSLDGILSSGPSPSPAGGAAAEAKPAAADSELQSSRNLEP